VPESRAAAGFEDRREAGRRLAAELQTLRAEHPLVLALPRGGVPVAYEIALALSAPLDLIMVRKIGAPQFEELALAAVVDGASPELHINYELVAQVQPPPGYIDEQMREKLRQIEQRRALYCGDRPAPAVNGRCVIIVDDGIATGASARAALRSLRRAGPRRLLLAVPVAAAETVQALRGEADEIISLLTPADLTSVGAYYRDFDPTEDAEVIELLSAARDLQPGSVSGGAAPRAARN
jgi:putative phosphoribosyl transferase